MNLYIIENLVFIVTSCWLVFSVGSSSSKWLCSGKISVLSCVINFSDHLVTTSSVKVETFPKALKVRQSRSKADGSPEESTPENWEQIVEGIRYSSSTFTWAWE